MTDKVYHSFGRTYRSRAAATAIQYAGGSEGWVVPSDQRLMEDPEGDLVAGALNAFGESHSSSSFDVTIDTGEALVGGVYLARDTTTTVTLDSSTTGQTVYVGWGDSQTDTVIIGKSGAFGSNDPKIPIWTFDTDGSGVTSATKEYTTSQDQASVGNSVSYLQSTEPEYDEQATWLNPDSGVFYAAYNGDWRPIPPVTVTEEAVTFEEDAVSVSADTTAIVSGSVQLGVNGTGNATSRTDDDNSLSTSGKFGLEINPNTDLDGLIYTLSSNTSGATSAYILDSNGNTIAESAIIDGTVELEASLTSGTTYYAVVDSGDDSYTIGYYDAPSYPYTGTDLDITAGAEGASANSGRAYTIKSIESATPATSGSATISWPSPDDIKSWDLATFQSTEDGETVTVDVESGYPLWEPTSASHAFTNHTNVTGIGYDGSSFWVTDYNEAGVIEYDEDWNRIGFVDLSTNTSNPREAYWDGTNYLVPDSNDAVIHEYDSTWTYVTSYDVSTEDGSPMGVYWDGTNYWVTGDSNDTVYQYDSSWGYTSTSYALDSNNSRPATLDKINSNWYVLDYNSAVVYEYDESWSFTGNTHDISNEASGPNGFVWVNNIIWVADNNSDNAVEFGGGLKTEYSDISQNFDVSTISTDKHVNITANLSRNDTANNPTLDYAARRFVR